MINERLSSIYNELPSDVKLVAVSKFHPAQSIREAYDAGQRVFGESRPQEFASKAESLPGDIEWHFIGHLQTNKLKLVLPYASLVESVDSERLLSAIQNWSAANAKVTDVLLELHLGAEQTKQGFTPSEIEDILVHASDYPNIRFRGLMGMATNTDSEELIRADFARIAELKRILTEKFGNLTDFDELSIGMSQDWKIALDYGATIVRIGTAIFGQRQY